MEFSRQEYWSGLPLPSPGEPPHPEVKSESLASSALGSSLPLGPPHILYYIYILYTSIYNYMYIIYAYMIKCMYYMYITYAVYFFKFFSIVGYYRILNIVPHAAQ